MEQFIAHLLQGTHGAVAYGMVFGILILCGLGLPLPEDVSLILGGYLAYSGAVRVDYMLVTGFLGILAGDSIIFFFGRKLGRNINPDSWIGRHVTTEKLLKVEGLFKRWGQKIVMAARFMPGVRAPVYFTAGASGIPYYRFILFDGMAACLSAPLFILCGKHFGGEIVHFIAMARRAQGLLFGVVIVLALAYFLLSRRRVRAEALELSGPQPMTPTGATVATSETSGETKAASESAPTPSLPAAK